MRLLFYTVFFFSIPSYSQIINITLDSVSFNLESYHREYSLKKSGSISGEGWKIKKNNELGHIFFGDVSYNRFYEAGSWTTSNDSIVFSLKNKKLLKRGYSERIPFKPFLVSWELQTDFRNRDGNKRHSFVNKLIVLNNASTSLLLFKKIEIIINSNLNESKNQLNPDNILDYAELNEKTINEINDFLYGENLVSSIETLQEFK
jgi:hypothetical protein